MKKILASFLLALWIAPVFASEKTCNLFDVNSMGETLDITLSALPQIKPTSGSCSIVMPVESNTTYTISLSRDFDLTLFRAASVSQLATNENTTAINYKNLSSYAPITLNSGSNAKYLYVQINCTKIDEAKNYLMVVKGETAPTQYIQYDSTCEMCHLYDTATGNTTWTGTPSPTTPVTLVNYNQGNIELRKSINADTYDATTGKITRRVGVITLKGTESFTYNSPLTNMFCLTEPSVLSTTSSRAIISTHFGTQETLPNAEARNGLILRSSEGKIGMGYSAANGDVDTFKQWLAQQYANGTPVTVYYPLVEPIEETIGTEWCDIISPIRIATTVYNSARFSPVVTELNDTIATIRDVVTNTINQTKAIADLQATKQTRPNENCPAGKKCLLVEDDAGMPHWYEIVESPEVQ